MTRWLVVNADDFGLSESINRGVIEAYDHGIVSSTTLMANLPGFDDAVARSRSHPGLGMGWHFNLTYGEPLAGAEQVPSLVDADGHFSHLDRDRRSQSWSTEEVAREMAAQWARLQAAGVRPTHIDSHHHIQRYPCVYDPLTALAKREGLPMRRTKPHWLEGHPPTTNFVILDEYFEGDYATRLRAHLYRLRHGVTELNCHPGHVDAVVARISPWTTEREIECELFSDPRLRQWVDGLGIHRVHFGDLVAGDLLVREK